MPDKDVARSIRFTSRLWDAIDQDAKRCKRSSQKHLEAILETYYQIADVEIDMPRIEATRGVKTAEARGVTVEDLAPVVAHPESKKLVERMIFPEEVAREHLTLLKQIGRRPAWYEMEA